MIHQGSLSFKRIVTFHQTSNMVNKLFFNIKDSSLKVVFIMYTVFFFNQGQDCSPTLWNLKSEPTSVKRPMDKNENRTTKRKLEIKVDTSADSFLKVKIAHEMPSAYVHFQTPSTTSFSNNFASMNKLIQNTFGQIPASTTHLHSGFTSDFYNPISYNEMLRSFNSNLESSSNANQKNCNSGLEFGEQYSNWLSQFTNVLNENAVDISKDEVKVRLNAY